VNCRRNDFNGTAHSGDGLGKIKVCMVIRHEKFCVRPVYYEEYDSSFPLGKKSGKFFQMPCPSCRDCIGKHGNLISHQGARFNLHINFFPSIVQKKVKAASTHCCLCLDNLCPSKVLYESILYKIPRNLICSVGMKHYWNTFPFNSNNGKGGLSQGA